jgi:hypothetical protein
MSNPDSFEGKIEAMARAFYEARESRVPAEYVPFDDLFDMGKDVWLGYARAAAEAIGLREGSVIVPREPTGAMIDAGHPLMNREGAAYAQACYHAMIAASPT